MYWWWWKTPTEEKYIFKFIVCNTWVIVMFIVIHKSIGAEYNHFDDYVVQENLQSTVWIQYIECKWKKYTSFLETGFNTSTPSAFQKICFNCNATDSTLRWILILWPFSQTFWQKVWFVETEQLPIFVQQYNCRGPEGITSLRTNSIASFVSKCISSEAILSCLCCVLMMCAKYFVALASYIYIFYNGFM